MYVGIDAGASATKAVIINEREEIISYAIVPSGVNFKASAEEALKKALEKGNLTERAVLHVVSTGYGRELVNANATFSEIICIARGVSKLIPEARTIIDVGGQDSKAIRIDLSGRVLDFVMNDKCAAGTGRFLEVMANILRRSIEELGSLHLKSSNPIKISSTCTVFAESEVISYISRGRPIEDVIAGLHYAIAERVLTMASRIGLEREVVLTGGVAKNLGFVEAISSKMGFKPLIPKEPQIVCAFGAALLARRSHTAR
ncbi:MAG: acyl-CoA dehydratase activase [Candidatus Nezhaarchaeota archaeon]|nr:acyl-CoA dehydratase activase [Candidatus Nezhaarchaeota archaeon]MCX8141775.1 acyl-CoA dehydratase activase [Candidatus Nezhaarchaeota archaeon]MDW8050447.1 acyl-CoA dehydratase activase [Nitrososphaerota archaeon]